MLIQNGLKPDNRPLRAKTLIGNREGQIWDSVFLGKAQIQDTADAREADCATSGRGHYFIVSTKNNKQTLSLLDLDWIYIREGEFGWKQSLYKNKVSKIKYFLKMTA